jgi:hypothetical protein
MVFENGVKNIQAAAYNGTRTVHILKAFKAFLLNLEMGSNSTKQVLVASNCTIS